MEWAPPKGEGGGLGLGFGFGSIGEDIHEDILSRLPASSFAAAACVNRSWSLICNRLLIRPKLLSALSLNPHLEDAVTEVLNKVLSEPIRPHFAIASIGSKFSLSNSYDLIKSKLGSRIPIIISEAPGIIGRNALTNQHQEVQWVEDGDEDDGIVEAYNLSTNRNCSIVLTIGFLPGLKVCAIPLMREGSSQISRIDKFVMDIKDYTASVSGSTAPVGIIMFAEQYADMKPVLEKMDYAMSKDTIIVGDESGCFVCNNGVDSTMFAGSKLYFQRKNNKGRKYRIIEGDAIALILATDAGKPPGIGEIQLCLALSTGVSPIGPTYKGASVRVAKNEEYGCSTWLTARREGSTEKLDGESILQDIEDLVEHEVLDNDLYIGVTKRRKCSIGLERGKVITSLSFHEVLRGDEAYLYVKGDGIKTGDTFQFFQPDPQRALTSCNDLSEKLRAMKQSIGDKKIVCGGLMFSCCGRGESFLGQPNVDSSAFFENFPGVPLSGVFCGGEIGRSSSTSIGEYNGGNGSSSNCFLHVFSSVYLLILHVPSSS